MKQTNLQEVRNMAILFLNSEPKPLLLNVLVDHPYFDSIYLPCIDDHGKFFNVLEDEFQLVKYKTKMQELIMNSDLDHILALMLPKYHLAFLKYIKPYLSKKDFDNHLAYIWVASENPNQDKNVGIRTLISWFKQANKKYLMSEDELEYYRNLPDVVNVYRGVAVGRAASNGLSWTCNYKTAEWFANRFNTGNRRGYVIKGKINKADIFAYFNSRGEDEVLCNSTKVNIIA